MSDGARQRGRGRPAIISVPLGFAACILGSLFSREEARAEREFSELHVRSETGLGAEVAIEGAGLNGGPSQEPEREPELVSTR